VGQMKVPLGTPLNNGTGSIRPTIQAGLSLKPVSLYCSSLDEGFESAERRLLRGNGVQQGLRKGRSCRRDASE
jgi:hypothetical protein